MSATVVVLIGCSSKKLDRAASARELYTSALFAKSVAYAEALGAEWAILSAKHGLVLPDQVLEPYDYTFKNLRREWRSPKAAIQFWARRVQADLRAKWPSAEFVIGERLSWLTTETEKLLEGRDAEHGECDFCGTPTLCATSELGHQRFEGDDTPARICEGCSRWALDQLTSKAASGTIGGQGDSREGEAEAQGPAPARSEEEEERAHRALRDGGAEGRSREAAPEGAAQRGGDALGVGAPETPRQVVAPRAGAEASA